jgi:hypothetical protein
VLRLDPEPGPVERRQEEKTSVSSVATGSSPITASAIAAVARGSIDIAWL